MSPAADTYSQELESTQLTPLASSRDSTTPSTPSVTTHSFNLNTLLSNEAPYPQREVLPDPHTVHSTHIPLSRATDTSMPFGVDGYGFKGGESSRLSYEMGMTPGGRLMQFSPTPPSNSCPPSTIPTPYPYLPVSANLSIGSPGYAASGQYMSNQQDNSARPRPRVTVEDIDEDDEPRPSTKSTSPATTGNAAITEQPPAKKRGRPPKKSADGTPATATTTRTATTTTKTSNKKRSTPANDSDIEEVEGGPQAKRARKGREPGALGYTKEEIFHLLRLILRIAPYGEKKWKLLARAYAIWAEQRGRPVRNAASLRGKFLSLIRMGKPTGRGTCPRHIEKAHEVNSELEARIAMGEVDDSSEVPQEWEKEVSAAIREGDGLLDGDDDDDVASDTESDLYVTDAEAEESRETGEGPMRDLGKKSSGKSSVGHAAAAQSTRSRARDFLANVESQLDPAAQAARRAEREEGRQRRQLDLIQAMRERDDRQELLELRRQNQELLQQLVNARLQIQELRMELRFAQMGGMGLGMGLGNNAFGGMNGGMNTYEEDHYYPYM